jgi:hypothetical protein
MRSHLESSAFLFSFGVTDAVELLESLGVCRGYVIDLQERLEQYGPATALLRFHQQPKAFHHFRIHLCRLASPHLVRHLLPFIRKELEDWVFSTWQDAEMHPSHRHAAASILAAIIVVEAVSVLVGTRASAAATGTAAQCFPRPACSRCKPRSSTRRVFSPRGRSLRAGYALPFCRGGLDVSTRNLGFHSRP